MLTSIDSIGLNFNNSYSKLPQILMTKIKPIPVKSPKLIVFNNGLANNLDLQFNNIDESTVASLLSGNLLHKGSESIAQAYSGHQFGYFTTLGDGRATLIGEHITKNNERYDIQLKGSGRTPYSRNGDGRATLISMLREYLISEAMHGLGIKTTRSLSVVNTGEYVQREKNYIGGILTRIASSHIRIGTFQYLSSRGDLKSLKELIDYTLKRHYPNEPIHINEAITLLKMLIKKQISLIVDWMRVGFIHGVMNTDNMLISGETIDYGPCAFMDTYNPQTVFSSIDQNGRYSFINQSIITHWNISRFAETLIPFLDQSEKKAIEIGKKIIDAYSDLFEKEWLKMMKKKLGFINEKKEDYQIIQSLLNWMKINNADYTNTFIYLMNEKLYDKNIYNNESFEKIKEQINKRSLINNRKNNSSKKEMIKSNPLIIPRNHQIEKALNDIDIFDDYGLFYKLLDLIKNPYKENCQTKEFQIPPNNDFQKNYQTFCGT